MANVIVPNFTVSSTTDGRQCMWKATRALLAAGWKYKSGSDGTTKDTTGTFTNDRWGIGGGTNLIQVGAQTGTSPTVGAPSSGSSVISSVSGFVANSVGRFLKLAGFQNSGNNGTFRITAQTGTTVTIYNPNAVAETGNANTTWTEQQGGAAATVATAGTGGATTKRAIITGLTGMRASSTSSRGSIGNYLTIIGGAQSANNGHFLITRVISSTSVEIENSSATSVGETNNGSLIWAECDPLLQVYNTAWASSAPWINLQGPSTLKIPISTNSPSGTFLRGEFVTGGTSGATGQILGVVIDTSGGLGYLVVQPCTAGSGAGVRGWTNGETITGGTSGATVTGSGTVIEFVRELVFWCTASDTQRGHIYVQVVDQSGESASRFSALASTATAAICPGGATGSFPAVGSWVCCGTAASNASTTGQSFWNMANVGFSLGTCQIMVANAIGTTGVSEDGSYTILFAAASAGYNVQAWQFCEDSEDGDVDPYVTFFMTAQNGTYNGVRTTNSALNFGVQTDNMYQGYWGAFSWGKGWRRRGMASGDAWQEFVMATLVSSTTSVIGQNSGSVEKVANVPDPNSLAVKEPLWVVSAQLNSKMRKGRLRWWYMTQSAALNQLYDNGKYIGAGTSSSIGGYIIGPWDTVTPAFHG